MISTKYFDHTILKPPTTEEELKKATGSDRRGRQTYLT